MWVVLGWAEASAWGCWVGEGACCAGAWASRAGWPTSPPPLSSRRLTLSHHPVIPPPPLALSIHLSHNPPLTHPPSAHPRPAARLPAAGQPAACICLRGNHVWPGVCKSGRAGRLCHGCHQGAVPDCPRSSRLRCEPNWVFVCSPWAISLCRWLVQRLERRWAAQLGN